MEIFKFCIGTFPIMFFIAIGIHLIDNLSKINLKEIYIMFYTIGVVLLIIASILGWIKNKNNKR